MKLDQLHPSKYLGASDFPVPQIGVMAHIGMEEMNDGAMKPVLFFTNLPKGMVLNKTNAHTIGMAHGDETDNWSGKQIEVYQDHTLFQGEMKPCIRLRAAQPQTTQQPAQGVHQAPVTNVVQNTPPGLEPGVPHADTFPGDR